MRTYHFCTICDLTAVLHRGDMCVRCHAAIETLIYPNDRIEPTHAPRPPIGVRILHWITGRTPK